MTDQRTEKRKSFIINFIYFLLIIAIIWFVAKYMLGWILPFVFGFFIAALVQPAVTLLHRRVKIPRRAAGIICVLVFVLLFGGLLSLCVTKIISELIAVFQMLPGMFDRLSAAIRHISDGFSDYLDSMPEGVSQRLTGLLQGISAEITKLSSFAYGVVSFFMSLLSGVPGLLLDIVITIVSACFISMDYGRIRGFVMRQLPEKYQLWASDIKEFFFITIAKMVRAYFTLMLITFVELSVGLCLLSIPHAVTVAAVIAIVDILPVLGTGTILIPWAIVELIMGNIFRGIALAVIYAIIEVVRNILEPKIVGHHLGLYPLVTLLALFIGLKAMGFVGMFLFPIAVILIKHMQDTGKIRLWKD